MNRRALLNHKSNGKNHEAPPQLKARTGIEGFDEITNGGLPRGRTTLFEGGAGSGKTLMALQTLVNGARLYNEPGIFVAFEESAQRITANASKFGWDLKALQKKKLFFLDAQQTPDLIQSGGFDLGGMLAAIGAKAREMNAKRIVFDAIDVVLALLNDPAAERREIYRLHEWLLASGLTGIITSKLGILYQYDANAANRPQAGYMQFMVDCAVTLNHEMIKGTSQRNLRVLKYRGSAFSENESPFLIGSEGVQVAGAREMGNTKRGKAWNIEERISSGVARLDAMLGGGYYRGAGVLITGFPGTAKTTLGGAFAEAACKRGERTLFISFDSDANEVIRNLASVDIQLKRFVKNGMLRLVSARAIAGSSEIHFMQIKNLAKEHRARCLVIDPVSALAKAGNEGAAYSVAERLLDWTKQSGITLFCSSLLHESGPGTEGTPLQISTIADTWIHLNYLVHGGERNRGLSIIKSRGTAHSNQVRELVLSSSGVTLTDAYTAGGEVLMGTLRWEKERAVEAARDLAQAATEERRQEIEAEEAEIEARLKALQHALKAKRVQRVALGRSMADETADRADGRIQMRELRGADVP
jgi:circadian clock protein KaiC